MLREPTQQFLRDTSTMGCNGEQKWGDRFSVQWVSFSDITMITKYKIYWRNPGIYFLSDLITGLQDRRSKNYLGTFLNFRCDGIVDCADGSDEAKSLCNKTSRKSFLVMGIGT